MLESIYKNCGFYIGKYETGIENAPRDNGTEPTETAVIKPDAYPYNWVTCSQAQTLASNMESGNYNTSLMFGVQWDLVLKYLETNGTEQTKLKTDSTSCGNYINSSMKIINQNSKYAVGSGTSWKSGAYGKKATRILFSTGASSDFRNRGIYDLAGNVGEWTLENQIGTTEAGTVRGGSFMKKGTVAPMNNRSTSLEGVECGFRVVLY